MNDYAHSCFVIGSLTWMLLRLQSPMLFPYTTLFRPRHAGGERSRGAAPGRRADVPRRPAARDPRPHPGLALARPPQGVDRKSTRLISSHRCISYAVFCLKKKKKLVVLYDLISMV